MPGAIEQMALRKQMLERNRAPAPPPPDTEPEDLEPPPMPEDARVMGGRSFKFHRATPQRGIGGVTGRINPKTGQPYATYAEWAKDNMPDAYARSKVGRGAQSAPPPISQLAQEIRDPYGFGGGR